MAAYSDKNELFMLTRRIKLSSVLLDFKEAKNKDGSPKQTATDYVRDQLSNIASNQIRNAVLSEFERRIKEGKRLTKQLLSQFIRMLIYLKILSRRGFAN